MRPNYTLVLDGGSRGESSDFKTKPKRRSRTLPLSFSSLTLPLKPKMESRSSLDTSLELKEPKKKLQRTRDPFAPNKLRRAKDPFMDNVDDDGKKRLRRFDDSYLEFVHMEDRPTRLRRHSDPTPGKSNKLPRTKDPFTDTVDDDGKKRLRRFPDFYLEFVHMEDRPTQLRRLSDPLAEKEDDKPKRLIYHQNQVHPMTHLKAT